jgi:hypothetical protein
VVPRVDAKNSTSPSTRSVSLSPRHGWFRRRRAFRSREETTEATMSARTRKKALAKSTSATATPTPTQSLGIREAKADQAPADPTRVVHPESVPLEGAMQASRYDQVVPKAEPIRNDVPVTDEETRQFDVKKKQGKA